MKQHLQKMCWHSSVMHQRHVIKHHLNGPVDIALTSMLLQSKHFTLSKLTVVHIQQFTTSQHILETGSHHILGWTWYYLCWELYESCG